MYSVEKVQEFVKAAQDLKYTVDVYWSDRGPFFKVEVWWSTKNKKKEIVNVVLFEQSGRRVYLENSETKEFGKWIKANGKRKKK